MSRAEFNPRPRSPEIEAAVLRIVAGLAQHPVGDESLLDRPWSTIGLDSLDLLELAVRCEDEAGCSIPDSELLRWSAPRQVVAYLESL